MHVKTLAFVSPAPMRAFRKPGMVWSFRGTLRGEEMEGEPVHGWPGYGGAQVMSHPTGREGGSSTTRDQLSRWSGRVRPPSAKST
jgi:hypothetical protein